MDKDLQWWENPRYKTSIKLPVSVINSFSNSPAGEKEYWVIANNEETNKLLGQYLHACAQASTEQEAADKYFKMLGSMHDFMHDRWLSYQRWVPLITGDWKHSGGKWFTIFGVHFYFRTANERTKSFMVGGWFIPFTNLNISITSAWKTYRDFKKKKK